MAGAIVSAVAGAVSIAVSLLVASAVTDLATTTPTFAATPAVTTGPTMPVDTVPAGALTKTWSFSGSAAGGYSMAGTLKVGAPEEVQTGLTIGNATLQTANGAGCAVDSTTDAVVPAELSVRNTSQDFDARVGITIDDDLGGHQLNAYTSDVQWEGQYTSGMACDSDTDETINLSSNDDPVFVHSHRLRLHHLHQLLQSGIPEGEPGHLERRDSRYRRGAGGRQYIPGHLLHHHIGHRPWGHIGNAGGVVVLPLGEPSAVLVDHDHDAALDDDNAADRTADIGGAHRPGGRR